MADRLPHIFYILSDEHRGQAMSHIGDPNVKTPAMDKLALSGASFARASANCPICTPARGTIFSGRHAHSGPVAAFFDTYKVAAPSAATELRKMGYHTAYFGKWHCGIVRDQVPQVLRDKFGDVGEGYARTPERHRAGFQDWFGYECINRHSSSFYYKGRDTEPTFLDSYETDGLTDLSLDYLRQYDRDEPLFMVLSINPPHFPFDVPEKWNRFDPDSLELRPNFSREHPEWRETLATYYAMIENLDWNIGRLADHIRSTPGFEDSLIVYFSDHGDFLGSHGHQYGKALPHEESIRIPAIFNWPGKIPESGLTEGLFSLVDMLPTTLGLLGAEVPEWVQGTDFSPKLRGESFNGPDRVLLEMCINPHWRMEGLDWRGILTEDWKYAFYEDGREELFDTRNDPYEMSDIAESNPDQCQKMRELLLDELERTREPFFDVVIRYTEPCEVESIDITKCS